MAADAPVFQTSHDCMACHNGLTTPAGEDVSFGTAWRATMMANSARDPYWQASVRRETVDHPGAAAEIEDECSVCHMPMARTLDAAAGRLGRVFAHLPVGQAAGDAARLAADGVSCTLCHQITPGGFGRRESFSGGYIIDMQAATARPLFGPYPVPPGRATVMHSATGYRPEESAHVRQSELCATCHTLYTTARGPGGQVVGELPEQVPYLEWRHSAFRAERSCQSCHMPVIAEPTRIASVLGEPREAAARHDFRGGNFFMLRMLNRYRDELGVEALPQELDAGARATVHHLQTGSASIAVEAHAVKPARLEVDVTVTNLAGHKLPTAYPSRRAWIHMVVRDGPGQVIFESGSMAGNGSIAGNDNDADGARFEPHHVEITLPDQVQVYESVMVDSRGAVTTGLLSGIRFVKDNRLLPRGFDQASAGLDIAVQGAAARDEDFRGGSDRVRYRIPTGSHRGPWRIDVALRYQPIAYRWAENLRGYAGSEPARFVRYYESMAATSSEILARHSITVDPAR
ncbi:MAG TPA: hypothetical protein VD833_08395 [Vicinamibacterales bacterium]|nr:hypothetical protein [Vicinamibacterales bacterium]